MHGRKITFFILFHNSNQSIYSTFAEEVTTVEEETIEETPKDVEATATITETKPKAPEFVVVLENVSVKEGKPAKFVAKATGEPTPKITWYHDNEPITEGDIYKIRYESSFKNTLFLGNWLSKSVLTMLFVTFEKYNQSI